MRLNIANILKSVAAGLLILLLSSCDEQNLPNPEDGFDKKQMLVNIALNQITPGYESMRSATDSLQAMQQAFIVSADINTLQALQSQLTRSYMLFQTISVYEIGPAETELYRANVNTFPCDTAQIIAKIAAADYSISAAADIDAKGFPALDFLLFDINGNQQRVLNRFTQNPDSAKFKTYLTTLVSEIATKTKNIHDAWKTIAGNYFTTFVNNTGSNIGGSIGMLVNQLCFDLEVLKNGSIGIPAGKKSMGVLYPNKTEAYFSKGSLLLAKTRLETLKNLYLGNNNKDSIGFDDYLKHVDAKYGQEPLHKAINNKFVAAQNKLHAIQETLAQSVQTQANAIDETYNELQQLVVLLKVDMTSALGIQITYQDNDGD